MPLTGRNLSPREIGSLLPMQAADPQDTGQGCILSPAMGLHTRAREQSVQPVSR